MTEDTARRFREGGASRYRDLYTAYHPRVLAYLVRRVGRQDAADLAAEVFEVAWRRIADVPQGGLLPDAEWAFWPVLPHGQFVAWGG